MGGLQNNSNTSYIFHVLFDIYYSKVQQFSPCRGNKLKVTCGDEGKGERKLVVVQTNTICFNAKSFRLKPTEGMDWQVGEELEYFMVVE